MPNREHSAQPFAALHSAGEVRCEADASSDVAAELSVEALPSIGAALGRRALWNWPGSRDSDLDFFLYFARARAEVIRPHVLVVSRRETPLAMLIGKLEHRRVPLRLGRWNFDGPRLRVLTFVYGGLRGSADPAITEALVREILRTLRGGTAEMVVFEPVPVSSQLFRSLQSVAGRLERPFFSARQNHYRMNLPRDARELHDLLSSRQRANYRRKWRKLAAAFSGDVACRWFCSPSPDLFRDLEFVASRSRQRSLGVGFADTPELRAWWDFAAAMGWLRVCILYAAGNPRAFWTGVAHEGVLWGDFMAYDLQLAPYSPGLFLLFRSIEEMCAGKAGDGIRQINLGPGDSELKLLLAASNKPETSVYLYPPTPRGAALNLLFSSTLLADASARRLLAHARLLAKAARRVRPLHPDQLPQ